jgi:hypothetical protein
MRNQKQLRSETRHWTSYGIGVDQYQHVPALVVEMAVAMREDETPLHD